MDAQHARAERRGRRGRAVAIAVAASVAIHAGAFAWLVLRLDDSVASRVDAMLVRLVLPPGTLLPAPDGDGPLAPRTTLAAGSRVFPAGCRGEIYTGIGARVNGAGFIVDLAAGGPAERAGLRPGDAILNVEDLPIDVYPVGQSVGLRLLRDGVETAAVVRIGAICNEPQAKVA